MKKIFSFAIIMAAAAMISCGGNANTTADAEVEETAVVEETTCCGECEKADSTCCGCCEEAPAEEAPAQAE